MSNLPQQSIDNFLTNIKDDDMYMEIVNGNRELSDMMFNSIEELTCSYTMSEKAIDILKSARDALLDGDKELAEQFAQDYHDTITKARNHFTKAMQELQ